MLVGHVRYLMRDKLKGARFIGRSPD
jgi:hypothetical protein